MSKYHVILTPEASRWQLWAAVNLADNGADVTIIHNAPYCKPAPQSWQQSLEQKKCYVEIDENRIKSIKHTDIKVEDGDVIINICGVPSEFLRSTYGSNIRIWDVYYHNARLASLSHLGEMEQQQRCATIDIRLIEDNSQLVDTARYNIHYSAVRNFSVAAYSVYWLIIKAIKANSKTTSAISLKEESVTYSKSKYIFSFYRTIATMKLNELRNRLTGFYDEQWTVGIGKGSFIEKGIKDLHVLPMPKDEFWADPFLYHNKVDGKNYLFIERFPFDSKKGVLSCGEINENLNVHNMHDVLVRDYHFSYPHLIEEDGELFMMPECSANRRLEVYRCVDFPDKWELYSTGMEGESLADTVYYRDKNGDAWIFTAQRDTSADLHCTLMNIYKVDSLKFNKVTPHRLNPIIIDSSHSRNGGRIYEEDSKLYRVAQDNTHGRYGYGISVRQIIKLTLEEYEEVEVKYQKGEDIPGFIGTHQMCQIEGMFVMDLRKV